MTEVVIDASAVLADLRGEPGAAQAREALEAAFISTVNYSEVIAKLIEFGLPPLAAEEVAEQIGYVVVVADQAHGGRAGQLHAKTRGKGVSLGDRFCLSLAQAMALPVVTADRRWKDLDLGVEVILIR